MFRTEVCRASWSGQLSFRVGESHYLEPCNNCMCLSCCHSCLWCVSGVIYKCTWTEDFGSCTQIWYKPSQASCYGKIMSVSTSSPICERGPYSQSIMGMGLVWTTSHQHRQHHSSSSMIHLIMRRKNCIGLCEANIALSTWEGMH
jgi:hypothetical protein